MQSIITYDDKVALYENPLIDDINKVNASDMNEIKSIINGSLQGTNAMGSIVVDDVNCKNIFDGLLEDNAIDINTGQNATTSNRRRSVGYIAVQPNTTYTLSFQVEAGLIIFEYQANKTYIGSITSAFVNAPYTFTTSSNTYYIRFSANSSSVTTAQLELGSEATEYVEGKKIIKEQNGYVKENTTFYANDFKCKNMLNKNVWSKNYINPTNGAVTSSNNAGLFDYIEVDQSTEYTLSFSSTINDCRVAYYTSSQTWISSSASITTTTTFTTPSNAKYIRIYINVDGNGIDQTKINNLNCQVEVGTIATTYTPYKNFDNTTIMYNLSDYIASGLTIDSSSLVSNDGIAILSFNISKSTSYSINTNITICTLPEALRPKNTIVGSCTFHSAGSNISAGYIVINTNGVVNVRTSASSENSCMGNITYSLI